MRDETEEREGRKGREMGRKEEEKGRKGEESRVQVTHLSVQWKVVYCWYVVVPWSWLVIQHDICLGLSWTS